MVQKYKKFFILLCIFLAVLVPFRSYATEIDQSITTENNVFGEADNNEFAEVAVLDPMLDMVFDYSDSDEHSTFSLLSNSNAIAIEALDNFSDISTSNGQFFWFLKVLAVVTFTFAFIHGISKQDVFKYSDDIEYTVLLKPMLTWCFSVICILAIDVIMKLILYIVQFIIIHAPNFNASLGDLGLGGINYKDTIYDAAGYIRVAPGEELGLVDTFKNTTAFLNVFISFAIPWLMSMLSSVAMLFVVYLRATNLVFYTLVAPIAAVNYVSDDAGKQSKFISFIKQYTSLCLQALIVIGIIVGFNQISVIFLEDVALELAGQELTMGTLATAGLKLSLLRFVEAGALLSSKSVAKELFS